MRCSTWGFSSRSISRFLLSLLMIYLRSKLRIEGIVDESVMFIIKQAVSFMPRVHPPSVSRLVNESTMLALHSV